MSSVNDVFTYSVTGSGSEEFTLRGGAYGVTVAANSWGTVALNVLCADRTTYVPYQTWSANTAADFNLTGGSYQFVYSSVDTASLSIAQQPNAGWMPTASLPLPIESTGGVTYYGWVGTDTETDLRGPNGSGAWVYSIDNNAGASAQVGLGTGSASANSAICWVYTGNSTGGDTGPVNIGSGNADTGNSGDILLQVGTAPGGTRGNIVLDTEIVTAPTDSFLELGSSGIGGADLFSAQVTGSDNSGPVGLGSGSADSGDTGDVQIYTGSSTSGNTGSLTLEVGFAGGSTRGNLLISGIPTADPHVLHAVWNSSGTLKISAGA